MTQTFFDKLKAAIQQNQSLLCIGLDPNPFKYPTHFGAEANADALLTWGKQIIEQTADLVCCYKPNIAFYEQFGAEGTNALRETIAAIPKDIPVLLDAKRGDIGSTAEAYARAIFDYFQADAVTLNSYLGADSIDPFLAYEGKATFVLCYTSNPSAQEIQTFSDGQTQLYEQVVQKASQWGNTEQIAFVVGATQPQALARFRQLNDDNWILAPGIGAQGGDLEAALTAGLNSRGEGLIIPVSRGVIYADEPKKAAESLRQNINQARQAIRTKAKPHPHAALITQLHEIGCVKFGEFTLASGKQSPVYIDLRRMSGRASVLKMAAQAYTDILDKLDFEHVVGVPYGALPVGVAIALQLNRSLVYPRKESKDYGTARQVEGVFSAGDKAVIIEDVVTSGGSVVKAIDSVEAAGLVVSDAVVLIDREQGAQEMLADKGYTLHSALSMAEILDTLQAAERISAEEVAKVKQYLEGN
ncbi:MAG: orotidine-5'-phosphate decarboxylase [Chloroflexota bacterium]